MKLQQFMLSLVLSSASMVIANNSDRFNYRGTSDNDYGPADWGEVSCDDPGNCDGFPNGWTTAVGWNLTDTNAGCEVCVDNAVKNNNCMNCPEGGPDCGQQRQSPINLLRDRGLWNHPDYKECPDWHYMKYQDGACSWDDLVNNSKSIHRNNFKIERHALQILQPVDDEGVLRCFNETIGGNVYPRLDYSKGFPRWWHLSHTEIQVPSEHTQEGKRYDAEVSLSHFYEEYHERNQLGEVIVFLNAYDWAEPWAYLDKLICQWRETEEQNRKECGLDSVYTFYPGCTNYERGHTPVPTPAPTTREPSASPSSTPTISFAPTYPKSANAVYYDRCFPCGSKDKVFSAMDPVVNIPVFEPMTCANLQAAARIGLVRPEFCVILPAFVGPCECVDVTPPPIAPVTSAPVTSAPISFAPDSFAPFVQIKIDPKSEKDKSSMPSSSPSSLPSSIPSSMPSGSSMPSLEPSETSLDRVIPSQGLIPPETTCPSFSDVDTGIIVNYRRMCEDGGCCDETRSATNFCHDAYSFFGDTMASVCWWCCDDTGPKVLAPAPAPHSDLPLLDCAEVDNPHRMCNPEVDTSCCGVRSETNYCKSVYEMYPGDLMRSVCYYCCETPMDLIDDVNGTSTRKLRLGSGNNGHFPASKLTSEERQLKLLKALSELTPEQEERKTALRHPIPFARVNYLKVAPENHVFQDYLFDDEAYFQSLWERHLLNENVIKDEEERARRRLVNYEDVFYWPYEWLIKVKTEYYYRYEGTLTVPPCKDQVHFRPMKDPIPVARRQIDELERLMAERISPKGSRFKECKPDNAGKQRKDVNGTAIEGKFDFARPVQQMHKLHREVFCECKDWKSKFQIDRAWCARHIFNRFYEHPYNFNTSGLF